jgi:hypothetical protein
MAKSDFIPPADHDFLVWIDRLLANLASDQAAYGLADGDLAMLKETSADFHAKVAHASDAAAAAKQATADKTHSRQVAESGVRALVRRIKSHPGYTEGQGAHLGIEGPRETFDLSEAQPDLAGTDQTGGSVVLTFAKYKSDGINIYCQRETDADWVLLGRATVSPFADSRPLLHVGKPELRRYTAVYMLKDREIGHYSDDLVINCAP